MQIANKLRNILFWFSQLALFKQYLFIIFSCNLLFIISYMTFLHHEVNTYQQEITAQHKLQQQLLQQQQQIQSLPKLIKQLQQWRLTQQHLAQQLLIHHSLAQQLDVITRVGLLHQQHFVALHLATTQIQAHYLIQRVSLSTLSDFQHICQFLAGLAALPQLIILSNWHIQQKDTEAKWLRLDGTLQLYLPLKTHEK